jgi:rRNA maturation RNase YbeY
LDSNINFFSEDIDFPLESESAIKEWVIQSVEKENCHPGDINFIFTSDKYLLQINKDHLNHDYFTDIITFDYRIEDTISGDLFISIDRVKENSTQISTPFTEELHRVLIHGILHIIGYNDKSPEEESIIRTKEDFYLSLRTF